MELLYEHVTQQKEQNKLLEQKLEFVQEQLSLLRSREGIHEKRKVINANAQAGEIAIHQGDNSVSTINQIPIEPQLTINIFGQENVDHIDHASVVKLMKSVFDRFESASVVAEQALINGAIMVYSDSDHPENITCFIPNKKTGEALVHGKKGWEILPVTLICSPMTKKVLDVLFAKQPYPDHPAWKDVKPFDKFEDIYKVLRENEKKYSEGSGDMNTILVRNKALLRQALEVLPVAGDD